MSQILLTIFENDLNFLKSSHFINSYLKENPHADISILTDKKNESLVGLLPMISHAYFIDCDYIGSTLENPLFSDAYALNNLTESLSGCLDTNWAEIINYSNDSIGTYFVTALSANKKTGTSISNIGGPQTSNQWATYLNFITATKNNGIISSNTVRHYMLNIPFHKEGNKVKINEEYSAIASQNMAKIRKSKELTSNADIVGVSLEAGPDGRSIDFHSLCEIIDTLEASERFRVVLLLTGKESEKELVNQLNYKFDNNLISISTDYSALPSVVMNIDALISVKNSQMAIADLLETRIIEIDPTANNNVNFFAVNAGNYYVKQMNNTNICSDVNFILNQEFETDLPVHSMNSINKTYMQLEDDYGTFSTQIRGELNLQMELRYHVERLFHYQIMGYQTNKELIAHLKEHTDKDHLERFTMQIKDELTDTVKTLLAALRSLKGLKQSKNNLKNFIGHLDTLINKAKTDSITSGALAIFEGDIENIHSEDSDENIKAIEQNLFGLKNNLQLLTNILTDLLSEKSATKTTSIEA